MKEAPITAASTPKVSPFPHVLAALGIAAIVLMLATPSVLSWTVGREARTAASSQVKILSAAQRVEHYGTVLELSIKAVVANGDVVGALVRAPVQCLRRSYD